MSLTPLQRVREVCGGDAAFNIVTVGLRLALAASYLSAVADRFGLYGPFVSGAPGTVAWGDMSHFEAYTSMVIPWASGGLLTTLAWAATIMEIIVAIFLLIGWRVVEAALASAATLFTFGLGMATGLGEDVLSYSVPTATMASVALAVLVARSHQAAPVSVDAVLSKRASAGISVHASRS